MIDLSGKTALVTGAGSGIGRAATILLARLGARVAATGKNLEPLEELSQLLAEKQLTISALPMDVTKPEEVEGVVRSILSDFGKIDILVNSAGITNSVPFPELTLESWNETLKVNLTGSMLVTQKVTPSMMEQRWGRIINIASIYSGGIGISKPESASYCASKGGIIALTESLAVELAPHGILVNAVSPGSVDTDMNAALKENPQEYEKTIQSIPLRRLGKPEEIASVIAFLASEAASYITGSTVIVDGGKLAR